MIPCFVLDKISRKYPCWALMRYSVGHWIIGSKETTCTCISYLLSKYAMYMHIRVQFNCGILTNYSYIYCITFLKKRETFSFLQYFEINVCREQMKEMKLLILVNTITHFFCTVYYLKLKRWLMSTFNYMYNVHLYVSFFTVVYTFIKNILFIVSVSSIYAKST